MAFCVSFLCCVQAQISGHPPPQAAFCHLMYCKSGLSSRSHSNKTRHHYWYFPYDHAISPLPGDRGLRGCQGDPSTWADKYPGSAGANRATLWRLSFRETQHDGGNIQTPSQGRQAEPVWLLMLITQPKVTLDCQGS